MRASVPCRDLSEKAGGNTLQTLGCFVGEITECEGRLITSYTIDDRFKKKKPRQRRGFMRYQKLGCLAVIVRSSLC